MSRYFIDNLWNGQSWIKDVSIEVDKQGIITSMASDTVKSDDSEHLKGRVLPGMPNLHSHAFQRGISGLTEHHLQGKESFWTWRETMYRLLHQLTPEDVYIIAKFVYIEMLKAGYTCVGEFHYLHNSQDGSAYDDIAELSHATINAARDAGIAITHMPVLYSFSGFGDRPPEGAQLRFSMDVSQYAKLTEKLIQQYGVNQHTGVSIALSPHSLRAVNHHQLKELETLSRQYGGLPIHIHIAEQQKEIEDCLAFYQERPVNWLCNHMPVDDRWCLVHTTHTQPDELERAARTGAIVGLCPTTEANLGDGLFDMSTWIQESGTWGIGSDSHISVDVIEELKWLEYGQRLKRQARNCLYDASTSHVGEYLYQSALEGGAKALNQNIGKLAKGKRADWLVVCSESPLLDVPDDLWLDNWTFSAQTTSIKDVMVAGKWQIKEGDHPDYLSACEDFRNLRRKLQG